MRIAGRAETASEPLVARIDALLPQTQCGRCGFSGCRPYAAAIARGDADIDRCPPGGNEGISALADLLGVPVKPLNPAHGEVQGKRVALILEDQCIGCTLCLKACPVDAIVGAPQWAHTVIAAECTGCELCVAPCPVDCIEMQAAQAVMDQRQARAQADHARRRHEARGLRLERESQRKDEQARRQLEALVRPGTEAIAAAIERARARKAAKRVGPDSPT